MDSVCEGFQPLCPFSREFQIDIKSKKWLKSIYICLTLSNAMLVFGRLLSNYTFDLIEKVPKQCRVCSTQPTFCFKKSDLVFVLRQTKDLKSQL